ncbi:MAG: hypothetical protein QME68_00565 [Elusimicrobiota bacterium]|nr:hypothetical protein [Elusimicrobiota bacterium]
MQNAEEGMILSSAFDGLFGCTLRLIANFQPRAVNSPAETADFIGFLNLTYQARK